MLPTRLRVGLLHLAPRLGDIDGNFALLARATRVAAERGARWVVSGELVLTGYQFVDQLGTDWIAAGGPALLERYSSVVADAGVVAFVHLPEVDATTGLVHSTMWVVDAEGQVVGSHRKIAVIPVAEDWATPGSTATVVEVDSVSVGLLVCADAHPSGIAAEAASEGAEILVSSAAWANGQWGPAGEWEQRSLDTGLPVVVANRTGSDLEMDFSQAPSVVVADGQRLLSRQSDHSLVVIVDLVRHPASGRFAAELLAEVELT